MTLVLVVLDTASGGALVHGYLVPLAAYTMVSVNLDFWEHFWLANRRAQPVLIYSAARLALRVVVVVSTAMLTHDFHVVIWALVALEGVRFAAAAIAMAYLTVADTSHPYGNPGVTRFDSACLPAQRRCVFGQSQQKFQQCHRGETPRGGRTGTIRHRAVRGTRGHDAQELDLERDTA